uniref:Uncharacterized protein n=1 Tax=Arundo donax TaxID=35708 RepID=A0A0A9BCP5_ARUDO
MENILQLPEGPHSLGPTNGRPICLFCPKPGIEIKVFP